MEMEKVQKLLDQSSPISHIGNVSMLYKMTPDHNLLSKYAWIIQVRDIPIDTTTWVATSNYVLNTKLPNIGVNIRFTRPSNIALKSSFKAFELALIGNGNSESDITYAEENRLLRIQMIGKNGLMQKSDWKVCKPGFFNFTDGIILENIPTLSVKDKVLRDILVVIIEIAEQSKVKWIMPIVQDKNALLSIVKLYESRDKTGDLEVDVKGQKIKAHKFILIARSTVFEAMLTKAEMKEKQLSQVEIKDFEPIIISELTKYLYIGKVDLKEYASELLKCADKYDVKELMELCQSYIGDNIPGFEWKELLGLLRTYGDRIPILKKSLKEYYDSNQSDLRGSDEFNAARKLFPIEFDEVYQNKKQKLG